MTKELTRKDLMLKGVLKKGPLLHVGERIYDVSPFLVKRIRLKNITLALFTVVLTLAYGFLGEKFRDIPIQGVDPKVFGEAILLSIAFVLLMVLMFLLTSLAFIPKDFQAHVHLQGEEEFF